MSETTRLESLSRSSHQASRRDEVLKRLIELFLREGFRALSVDDMARWARCSKRTIYTLGDSKEQVVLAVVRGFFRRSTLWIADRVKLTDDPIRQIGDYLRLIATALAPASRQFFIDVDAFAPASEIYRQNTRAAAEEVQRLVRAALGERSRMDAEFIGAVAGIVMNAIHRKELEETAALDDAEAYHALANLIVAGVRGDRA